VHLPKLYHAVVSTQFGTKATTCFHAFNSDIFGPLKETGLGGSLLGVIDHFSNYVWLLAFPSKKAIVPNPFLVLSTDIRNFHAHLYPDCAFTPTFKLNCDLNYLDVACRSMVYSLGYIAQSTIPYTHNQFAKMEREGATLADSATTILQHANGTIRTWALLCARLSIYSTDSLYRPPPAVLVCPSHHPSWHSHCLRPRQSLWLHGLPPLGGTLHGPTLTQAASLHVHWVMR
jgi:hypothetical protein